MKKNLIRAMSLLVCGAIGAGCMAGFVGCNPKKKDSIVIMTEELSGLYNPFYATSAPDQEVIGMTQISMLTYDVDEKGDAEVAYGSDYAVVTEDLEIKTQPTATGTETVYTFVIKNGLKFSDGVPLTINDVFFNLYEYLDPVYTGSSTMYSTKIKGLTEYRTQQKGNDNAEDGITAQATSLALLRRQELYYVYTITGEQPNSSGGASYSLSEQGMRDAINSWTISEGYKNAVATEIQQKTMTESDYRAQLLKDYDNVLKTFKEELESDYNAAKESYDLDSLPYSEHKDKLKSDIFKFLLYEGVITPNYKKDNGKEDKSHIVSFNNEGAVNTYKTKEAAIQKVYNDTVLEDFHTIITAWGTAGTILTEFTGAATEIVLKNMLGDSGEMIFPNIEGIKSLGHPTENDAHVAAVTVNGKSYTVAHEHNADGTPKNAGEYDVMQITVDGTDPKAVYNFSFSVAPAHYYTADTQHPNGRTIDIAHNEFGVEYASSGFQGNVIKSPAHIEVPVGAGPYMATNRGNSNNPQGNEFVSGNIVYFKKNPNFMFEVKNEKLRMQVVSSSDALDVLASGAVDYVTPQFTQANAAKLNNMTKKGDIVKLDAWQLGYGYIGINAGRVPDINIRKAIMSAMDVSEALQFYEQGTCDNIAWPMSKMSWAYPYVEGTHTGPGIGDEKDNGSAHSYTKWSGETTAKTKIQGYMSAAGVKAGDKELEITFTIAGASITEHPTYNVFKKARELLNSLGWNITLKADTQALTKLATGSLEVWAAAWGSTIDPDLYQVYHMNSKATSVYSWGYREILNNTTYYSYEYGIIKKLSDIIDDARETMDQDERTAMYETALGYILDLAVELPVYQRKNLYAYNSKTVKGFATEVNAFTSPLDRIWELELVK